MNQRFQALEASYRRWKAELEAGRISPAELDQQLEAAAIEHEGRWWMIGANSGKWFVSDGQRWLEAAPPEEPAPESVRTRSQETPVRTPPVTAMPAQPHGAGAAHAATSGRIGTRVMLLIGWLLVPGLLLSNFYLGVGSKFLFVLVLILSFDAMRSRRVPAAFFFAGAILLTVTSVTGMVSLLVASWWLSYCIRVIGIAAVIGGVLGILWHRLRRPRG